MSRNRPNPADLVHPDVAEPLTVHSIGTLRGRPFKKGRPPTTWKPDNVQRLDLTGFDLTYLHGREFELDFDTRGHLIDFNFGSGQSIMRVNSDTRETLDFQPYTTSFAPVGTDLYRHAIGDPENAGHRLIGLNVSPRYMNDLVSDLLDGRALSFVDKSRPDRWPSMDRIQSGLLALFEAPHRFSRLTAEALANDAIMRSLMRWSSIGNSLAPIRYKTDDKVVNRAIEFIGDNLTADISMNDIAKAAGRDVTILLHVFKLETGRTPYHHLLASRIDAAKRDLRNTDLSVAKLAERYRFGSPSHFSTTFRKYVGESPTLYRAQR